MSRKKKGREQSQRQLKVGELLRHALAEMFMRRALHDPLLREVSITVSEVRISPDLHNATAYVSALGGIEDKNALITRLNKVSPEIRSVVAKSVKLKYAPTIIFRYDDIFEQASHIDNLLKNTASVSTEPATVEE